MESEPRDETFDRAMILDPEDCAKLIPRPVPEAVLRYEPLGRRLVVLCEEPIKRTKAGIYVPDQAQERPAVGWVVSVGPNVGRAEPGLSHVWVGPREFLLGQRVLFGQYAGSTLFLEQIRPTNTFESSLLTLTDSDIWGIDHNPYQSNEFAESDGPAQRLVSTS